MSGSLPPQAPAEWYVATRRLLEVARAHWRMFALFGLVGGGAGAVTAFLQPSYFESGAAFQAETSQPTQLTGALAGLASQIGNLPLGSQNSGQFFSDLLTTDAVLRRVARASFPWRGVTASLATIYGFGDLPETLRDYNTVRKLRTAVRTDLNLRTGVVRFSVEARTPELAAALAETTLAALNAANIDLRQTRAAAERQFTSGRADAARQELDSTERALAAFYQQNRVITGSPLLQMQEAKLKRAVDMAQQVYVQLRLQEEQAAVQEVRNTPAISVIDPPSVPVRRSRPHRRVVALLGMAVGLLIAGVRLLLRA